jgi:hypothetical protein
VMPWYIICVVVGEQERANLYSGPYLPAVNCSMAIYIHLEN